MLIAFISLRLRRLIQLAQKAQIVLLMAKKVTVLYEYLKFTDIFSKESAAKLPKYFNINQYLINPELDKYPSYRLIYSLELVELKTIKTYIETNMPNGVIWLFIFSA